MTVTEYAAKFKERVEFCPHDNGATAGGSKIYNEDNMVRYALYKSLSEKKGRNQYHGKLYSASASKGKRKALDEKNTKTTSFDRLIRGTCFINGIPFIAIIDTWATYSFISLDYVESLGLKLPAMVGIMVIDTPTNGPVASSWVCLNFPLTIYGKSFGMDLVFLPWNQIDVILRMNWLEFNHIHINYFDKSMSFSEFDASDDLMKDEAEVFMILSSMKDESKSMIGKLPVVCDFPEVFLDDINDFPLEREVEFSIDLVPGTSYMLMDPYRIFASKLSELKK
ncbi:uncharacterized protein LOC127104864 [Lathyrus oleraceus]|uniref:uncharacterized protein LOC127104864 n=1 Tax=Pisum sativum TaxID=3888 RepID=UPI0021CF4F84|nr:uncharacterized protein LOC127104864 [Pisum sativum]